MKNILTKTTGVILILLTLLYTLTGCYLFEYSSGDIALGFEFTKRLIAMVKSEKIIFHKDDVSLDLLIGVYDSNREYHFNEEMFENYLLTVYVSNSSIMPFNWSGDTYIRDINDVDGAILLRTISHEEAFSEEYSYTVEKSIEYTHKEKITIPEELLVPDNKAVYIYVVELFCYKDENMTEGTEEQNKKVRVMNLTSITIKYQIKGDVVVIH